MSHKMKRLIIPLLLMMCLSTCLMAQKTAGKKGISHMASSSLTDSGEIEGLEAPDGDMGQLFLPILLAVIGFIGKTVWDIFTQRRTRKIALLQQKLSTFYWPIAVRFQQIETTFEKMFDNPDEPHSQEGTLSATLKQEIILKKHNEIVSIIENALHIVEPTEEFRALIGKYLKHVAIYNAIISTGIPDRFPAYYNAKFPKELIPLIESQTRELQNELNARIKKGI